MANIKLELNQVYIELNEAITRIEVHFKFDPERVKKIKTIPGRHFDWDTKIWDLPMEINVARRLRELFGDELKLGPALRMWARHEVNKERNMRSLHAATDADLSNTPKIIEDIIAGKAIRNKDWHLPAGHPLLKKRPERPYQRADIKMMSLGSAINANDVGTGKTLEVIGAIHEAEINPKPILVIAPRRALVNVWQDEFERLSDYKVWTSENPSERNQAIRNFLGGPSLNGNVLALIADDLRFIKYYDIKKSAPIEEDPLHACRDYQGNWYKYKSGVQKSLFMVPWGAVIIDECHSTGLPNRRSLFHVAAKQLVADRKWPMSATPIGGKARRLWPILNFIDPKAYSSEWRWIDLWLEVTEETFYKKGDRPGRPSGSSKTVGGIKPGREDDFYADHAKHMVRRTKFDALPGLPHSLEIIVETPMEGRQLADYQEFDDNHEIILEGGERMSGSIVLAQYTRLRQMASAQLEWDRFFTKPTASTNGCKYDHLIERLDENGIRKVDYEPGARAYIGVLDKGYLTAVMEILKKAGIEAARLDGDTKDSKPMLARFNSDSQKPFVIAMTIQTGGTALNLERANSAHALDEAWDPDVMHQFFGRGERGNRTTALRCYTYRTPNSIQEYVAQVAGDKKITNKNILAVAKDIEKLRNK